MKIATKICKHHGETIFVRRKDGTFRCRKCSVASVSRRRRLVKQKLVAMFGGVCSRCGYNKCIDALHFHHLDPGQKEFKLNFGKQTRSWERSVAEAKKCILVCANCHAELHSMK